VVTNDWMLLERARTIADGIVEPDGHTLAIQTVVVAMAQLSVNRRDIKLLERAYSLAESITSQNDKASSLQDIVCGYVALGKIRRARQIAMEQLDDGDKALTFATILQTGSPGNAGLRIDHRDTRRRRVTVALQ
jgi:hypothetical protein